MNIEAMFDLSYGLYIISAKDRQGRAGGCIVNTVFQLTAEPITVGVSVNYDNHTYTCIKESGMFSVSILAEAFSPILIGRFGFRSGRDTDKFEGVAVKDTQAGLPYLTENTCGYLQCRVIKEVDMGTHGIFLAEVTECEQLAPLPPMTYDYYHKVVKGKAPKTAPTYRPQNKPKQETKKETYVCSVCGYVYEGDFSALPDDWKCPVCGVGKEKFSKQD